MTLPLSIDSNVTGLAIAEESAIKTVSSPTWRGLEPNSYSKFGANFPSVAREPINSTRQKNRGTITDLQSDAQFNTDLTERNMIRLLQGFMFANIVEKANTQSINGAAVVITATAVDGYSAAAGLATAPSLFLARHLVLGRFFTNPINNGLGFVSTVSGTKVTITGKTMIVETPPATAHIQAVGYRCAAGDLKIAVSGALVNLTTATLDFTTLGLTVGEWIFLGGDAAINRWVTASGGIGTNCGYARISVIAAHTLTLDLTMFTPSLDADAGGLQQVDMYFGKIIYNATVPANIVRRTYQLERQLGSDGVGTQSEYITGAVPNEFTLNEPVAAKITCDLSYIGLGYETYDGTTGIKAGTRAAALGENAINTSHDIYLTRLSIVDPTTLNPTGLFAYVSDLKMTINNGAEAIKALGVLGGFSYSIGDFAVTASCTAFFQSIAGVNAIKNNTDACLTSIIARGNSGIFFDLPLLTLGGGENKVVKDKPIDVDLTQDGAKNLAGYTMMVGFWEYLPTIAQPV